MANENTFTADVASCNNFLLRLRQYLEHSRLYEASDDAHSAQVKLQQAHRQHDELAEQHELDIETVQLELATEQSAVQTSNRQLQSMQQRIDRQGAVIADHNRRIDDLKQDLETARSKTQTDSPTRVYREGYAAAVAACQEQVDDQTVTITAHVKTISSLQQKLEATKLHAQDEADEWYQQGYAMGFAAGLEDAARPLTPSPPPTSPPPYRPVVDYDTRKVWMAELLLSNNSYSHLSSNLKQTIMHGNTDMVASILHTRNAHLAPPALHLAALFGDIDIARLLLEHGMDVNGQCIAASDKPGRHVYGVTPMHLAIGAQHENMIKLLRKHGGSFDARPAAGGERTSAPPLWLISGRWLELSGKARPEDVLKILKLLQALGWDADARLNSKGETMKDLIRKEDFGCTGAVKWTVLKFLQE